MSNVGTEHVVQRAATPPTGERGLRARVARGSAWTLSAFVVGNVLRLASNLVLAYALFPEAFALVALASIVLQALQMFSDVGVGAAVVRSPRGNDPAFLNTAWTIQVARGVLLWVGTVALAWPVARFYETPELTWVIPAAGLSFISTGLQSTALYTSSRELRLGRITIMGLAETVLKTLITVVWALVWPSVWAIVGGSLIAYLAFMIGTHTLLPGIRNRFAWDRGAATELLNFGGWVFVSTSVTFIATQADRLILGKIAPMEVLGVYSIAYMFSRLPADIAQRLTTQVQFPALAEVFRREPDGLEAKLLESRRLLLGIAQFGTVGVIVVSPWFFSLLYDPRYEDAVLYAPMLAVVVWIALLQSVADRALLAAGDARSLAFSNSANALVTVPACVGGHLVAGMPGFIAGVGLGNLAGHAVVVGALRIRGARILGQDVRFTAVVAAAALIAYAPGALVARVGDSLASRIVLGLLALGLSAVCFWRVAGVWVERAMAKVTRVLRKHGPEVRAAGGGAA